MKERLNNGSSVIDFTNINYLEFKKNDDIYELYFLYRPKLKMDKVKIQKTFVSLNEMKKFLGDRNFYQFDKYFINVKMVQLIEEKIIKNSPQIEVIIYSSNFVPLLITTTKNNWLSFKNSRLV